MSGIGFALLEKKWPEYVCLLVTFIVMYTVSSISLSGIPLHIHKYVRTHVHTHISKL